MKALLLVDIQNDFVPGGALAIPHGSKIIPVVNGLQLYFELVVATQDWHPRDHISFASNHPGKNAFDTIDLGGLKQTLWPDHCVQGTAGADFVSSLDMTRAEAIVRKGTNRKIDSYSGFYDNGHLKSTGLGDYLRGRNVGELYLTGLAGDICVQFTGLDGLKQGFKTYIVEDAVAALSEKDFQKTKNAFDSCGGILIKSTDIVRNSKSQK